MRGTLEAPAAAVNGYNGPMPALYEAENPRPRASLTPLLLFLLALLALGGYAGQAWWAKRVAWMAQQALEASSARAPRDYRFVVATWRQAPWYGEWDPRYGWIPRRARYEFARLVTGRDLGDDPDAWEAWFREHPNLVWDAKGKRLVDRAQGF